MELYLFLQYKSRSSSYIFVFAILRLRSKRKMYPALSVLNAFDFQTGVNLRFKHKRDVRFTCKRVLCPLHRTLSLNQVINHPGKQALFHGFDQRFWKF